MSFETLKSRMIGIDTEYHTDFTKAIDRVFCLSATGPSGESKSWWLGDVERGGKADILDEVSAYFGIEEPIYICHAYDLAERQALHYLGSSYPRVFCTYLAARLCTNAASTTKAELSLASLCKALLGIDIDSVYKEEMRGYCIRGEVEGHEQEIMRYCESDTKHLINLAEVLVKEYDVACRASLPIRAAFDITDPCERLLALCDSLSTMGRVADRGFPVNMERIEAVVRGAVQDMDVKRAEFAEKYPGTFEKVIKKSKRKKDVEVEPVVKSISDLLNALPKRYAVVTQTGFDLNDEGMLIDTRTLGTWKKSTKAIQERLEQYLREKGCLDAYPRTPTGKLKTDTDTLADYFRGVEGFGGDLYSLERRLFMLSGIAQRGAKSWVKTARDGRMYYRSLKPFGAQTGRNTPSPSDGFVPGWKKMLYCVLDPPQGKWLVELDYGSEEVFLQAIIQKDSAYLQAYNAKDYYLWLCVALGLIPREDFETMDVGELKEKWGTIRSAIKTFALAWSYGAGVQTLACRAGITVQKAEEVKTLFDRKVFRASTEWKKKAGMALSKSNVRGLALRDGLILRTKAKRGEEMKRATSQGNFPIQGYGSVILRRLVTLVESEVPEVELCATVHDAVFFQCVEGDTESIARVRACMVRAVREVLSLEERDPDIKVGDPEIIAHGQLWTPEHRFDEDARQLLALGGLISP